MGEEETMAMLPHSICGLTKLLQSILNLYLFKNAKFLQIKPMIWLSLFIFSAI